jgi:hypothetical protein
MKYRIMIWASAGFFAACFWTIYAFEIPMTAAPRAVWILADVTSPVTLGVHYVRFYFYWALLANVATYAFFGLIVETLRRKFRFAQ